MFHFYDPYMSFFAGLTPAFRDDDGTVMKSTEGLPSLVAIGREISELIGPFENREEWNLACQSLLKMEPKFREMLSELSMNPHVSFVSPSGEKFDPDWEVFAYADLVSVVYQCLERARQAGGIKGKTEMGTLFSGPFAYIALMDIDDAIFHMLTGEDGTPNQLLESGIAAMRSLALAKEMAGAHLAANDGFARKGAAARHAPTREIRKFAISLYREGKFPSAHKASIEIKEAVLQESVRLNRPLSEDRAQKTIYDWLRNAKK